MAIKQTITLDGLEQVQTELKNLADVGTSAFERIRAAVEGGGGGFEAMATNITKVTSALTSLTGAVTVFAGLSAALIGVTVSASKAGEEFENLGVALGTSTENASALISSFARAGADIEGLAQGLRRAATNISQEWASIQKSVADASLKSRSDILSIQQAQNALGRATVALANQEQDAALQRQANAQNVAAAQQSLDDLLEKRRAREFGPDPILAAERAAAKEEDDIAKARLAVSQAIQKAKEDEAQAAIKASEAAIAAEAAQLSLEKARKQAADDQKDSIANLVGFVNDLTSGLTNTGREINRTVDNMFKGIVASAGGMHESLGQIEGDFANIASPTVLNVLLKTADVMHNLTSNTERQALASKLLGRSAGQELVSFLAQGSEAIKKYQDQVKSLGLTFSEGMAEATQKFRVQLFTLQDTLTRIKDQIGATFAPVFGPFFEGLADILARNKQLFIDWANSIASLVKPTLDSISRVLSGKGNEVDDKWLLDLIAGFKSFADTLTGIVVPAITSLLDIIGFIATEINSVFGTNLNAISLLFVAWLAKVLGVFRAFALALGILETALVAFGLRAGIALTPVIAAFTAGFLAVLGIMALVDKATFEALKGLGTDISNLVKKIGDNFGKAFEKDQTVEKLDELIKNETKAGTEGEVAGTKTAAAFDQATKSVKGTDDAMRDVSQSSSNLFEQINRSKPNVAAIFRVIPQVSTEGTQAFPALPGAEAEQATNQKAAKLVEPFAIAGNEINRIWADVMQNIQTSVSNLDLSSVTTSLVAPFQNAQSGVTAAIDAMIGKIRELIQAAAQLQVLPGGAPLGTGGIGSAATGGLVSGPGTTTSDSILAWLSNREFVVNAKAVSHYGPDLFAALNAMRLPVTPMGNFNMGGLARGFAGGGLVRSGNPVVLNIDRNSFKMTAGDDTITQLKRFAVASQLSSTGRKPRWVK